MSKYILVIDQAFSVKMAGYWSSSFFFACLWTDAESKSINLQKRKEVKECTKPLLCDANYDSQK